MNIKNLKKRIPIWYGVIRDFIISFWGSKAKILKAEETIEYVIKNNKSIIRLGDGEFNILNGRNIAYQKYSPELEKDMREILNNYFLEQENNEYILCVPNYFMKCNGIKLITKREYVASWAYSRKIFQKEFPQDIVYGDAFLFAKQNKHIYSKLWKNLNKSKCIFIHNNEKYAINFEKEYHIKTEFIKINSKDAYESLDEINIKIEEILKSTNKEEIIVVISAGPAGKVLAYRLSKHNILALDTGHCWDEPLIIEK